MIRNLFTLFLMLLGASTTSTGDDFCTYRNNSFIDGETISFKIQYTVIGLWADAGTATFTVNSTLFEDHPVYHITGVGTSNPSYDWIFKVRDKYETFIDTGSLRPYKFIRNVNEGGYKKYETVYFDHKKNVAISNTGTYKVPDCVQDVLSAIYYSRNIDFNKYKTGDRIPFSMFLDNEVFNMYIRYLGKEKITTRFGTYNAIKFKPLLLEGTIFSGGEKMNVWVSDDDNKIPLRIESPITVGKVMVDMTSYKKLRHPFKARISGK
jgi:Protein of unknown function (DUF3108)